MEMEELDIIEEKINNPPKDIKIKKGFKNILVKINTHQLSPLIFFAFILCWATFFTFFAFNGEQIFRKELDANNVISTFIWLVFAFFSIVLLYKSIYSIFGKIKLAYGNKNYISQGILNILNIKHIDWKNVSDFFQYHIIVEDDGDKIRTDYIVIKIKEKRTIRIRLDCLNDTKINYILLIIKYFRYRATSNMIN
ncbi:hypothetical protein FACS189476_06810 [Spirochaetia bacterium]|nr:hypothetical protein FACS189476_06810 [Spirochaetia bacterium]